MNFKIIFRTIAVLAFWSFVIPDRISSPIFFIALLVSKYYYNRNDMKTRTKPSKSFYIFLSWAVILVIGYENSESQNISAIIYHASAAISILLLDLKKIKDDKRDIYIYNQCIDLVFNLKEYSVSNIAKHLQLTEKQTIPYLQRLVDYGKFKNLYIINDSKTSLNPLSLSGSGFAKRMVVKCTSCGAANEVSNIGANYCTFCNNPLEYKN